VEWGEMIRNGRTIDHHKSGRPAFLDAVQQSLLETAIRHSDPKNHNFHFNKTWSGPIVKRWIFREFNIHMTVRHTQRILKAIRKKEIRS